MNSKLNSFHLWTAIITPLLENRKVDYDCFKKLLKKQEAANNAIVVLGSTGEGLNLNLEEKKEILTFACNQQLNVPLMAGVGGINLENTVKWLKFCEGLAIDAYLLVTPLYAKPGAKGQEHWFKTLMDNVSKPCCLYNIPGRSACSLSLKALENLKNHKNFWSVKEASGSIAEFQKFKEVLGDKLLFSGDDGMLLVFLVIF